MSAESEAEKRAEKMKVLVKEPGKPAEVREIENTLEACQKIVGGWIEVVRIFADVAIVVNEDGKINGMKPNFICCGDLICGPAFFCGVTSGRLDWVKFRGLDDDEINAVEFLFPYLKGEKP